MIPSLILHLLFVCLCVLSQSIFFLGFFFFNKIESLNMCENTRACLDPKFKIIAILLLLLLNQSVETRVNVRNEPILL